MALMYKKIVVAGKPINLISNDGVSWIAQGVSEFTPLPTTEQMPTPRDGYSRRNGMAGRTSGEYTVIKRGRTKILVRKRGDSSPHKKALAADNARRRSEVAHSRPQQEPLLPLSDMRMREPGHKYYEDGRTNGMRYKGLKAMDEVERAEMPDPEDI